MEGVSPMFSNEISFKNSSALYLIGKLCICFKNLDIPNAHILLKYNKGNIIV